MVCIKCENYYANSLSCQHKICDDCLEQLRGKEYWCTALELQEELDILSSRDGCSITRPVFHD